MKDQSWASLLRQGKTPHQDLQFILQRISERGFTLIELLIVVAIIGTLVSITLPQYQNSLLRSGRAEAKGEILQVVSDQERFYSSNNSYSTDATPLLVPVEAGRSRTTANSLYEISVSACDGGAISHCFIATATAQERQMSDACTTLSMTNTGVIGATGDSTGECWGR